MRKPAFVRHLRPAPWLLAAALLAACADEALGPAPPTMAAVAGDYATAGSFGALSFTTTTDDETLDWLELGAQLTLSLDAHGDVSGNLHIPVPDHVDPDYFEDEDRERGYFAADMAGTWTLNGATVRLEQDADSFMRDVDFVYTDGVLTGEETFDGVRIRVVLVRQ